MTRVRFSPEFDQVLELDGDLVVHVGSRVVGEAVREAVERVGHGFEEAVFVGDDVSPEVKLVVNGFRVAPGERVPDGAEVLVAPVKGSADAMANV